MAAILGGLSSEFSELEFGELEFGSWAVPVYVQATTVPFALKPQARQFIDVFDTLLVADMNQHVFGRLRQEFSPVVVSVSKSAALSVRYTVVMDRRPH